MLSLKELRNYIRKHNPLHNQDSKPFSFFFQIKFTLWHTRLNIYMWKAKFSSHKHYLFGILFSRNATKTHTDQSILPTFILCPKRIVSQTLKSSSCKKVFSNQSINQSIYFWKKLGCTKHLKLYINTLSYKTLNIFYSVW